MYVVNDSYFCSYYNCTILILVNNGAEYEKKICQEENKTKPKVSEIPNGKQISNMNQYRFPSICSAVINV